MILRYAPSCRPYSFVVYTLTSCQMILPDGRPWKVGALVWWPRWYSLSSMVEVSCLSLLFCEGCSVAIPSNFVLKQVQALSTSLQLRTSVHVTPRTASFSLLKSTSFQHQTDFFWHFGRAWNSPVVASRVILPRITTWSDFPRGGSACVCMWSLLIFDMTKSRHDFS